MRYWFATKHDTAFIAFRLLLRGFQHFPTNMSLQYFVNTVKIYCITTSLQELKLGNQQLH